MGVVKKMRGKKALLILKYGDDSIIKWLLSTFNRCVEIGIVSEDWKAACIIPVDKRRRYETE